jgi:hypothetical protein
VAAKGHRTGQRGREGERFHRDFLSLNCAVNAISVALFRRLWVPLMGQRNLGLTWYRRDLKLFTRPFRVSGKPPE